MIIPRGTYRVAAAIALTVGLAMSSGTARASTAGGVTGGWFWRENPGGLGDLQPESAVPAGELEVEFDGSYADARTALAIPVGRAAKLEIVAKVDGGNSSLPQEADIIACSAEYTWPREQAGPWGDQPGFSCPPQVAGTYDAREGTFTFNLTPLLSTVINGTLDVTLTPAGDVSAPDETVPEPGTPGPAWRVILEDPAHGVGVFRSGPAPTTRPAAQGPAQIPSPTSSAGALPQAGPFPQSASQPPPSVFPGFPPVPSPARRGVPVPIPTPLLAPNRQVAPALGPVATGTGGPWHTRNWPYALATLLLVGAVTLPMGAHRSRRVALQRRIAGAAPEQSALTVRDVRVRFGGVQAVDGVSFTVPPGQILGLIGPNGAGKTTILDAITGLVPSEGSVLLNGADVTNRSPAERATAGLGRSFQDGTLFASLTVRETLAVALEQHSARVGVLSGLLGVGRSASAEKATNRRVDELLNLMNLRAYADKFVSELSTGTRRIVDLTAQVAHGARVLLLDEPSSGIAQKEAEALGPLLGNLRQQLGCTMVVIEHDMSLINTVADRLLALETGSVIADGPPADVLHDPAVVAAYLGEPATPTTPRPRGRSWVVAT